MWDSYGLRCGLYITYIGYEEIMIIDSPFQETLSRWYTQTGEISTFTISLCIGAIDRFSIDGCFSIVRTLTGQRTCIETEYTNPALIRPG